MSEQDLIACPSCEQYVPSYNAYCPNCRGKLTGASPSPQKSFKATKPGSLGDYLGIGNILFGLAGIGALGSGSVIGFLFYAVAAAALTPMVNRQIAQKMGRDSFSLGARFGIAVLFIFAGGIIGSLTNKSAPTTTAQRIIDQPPPAKQVAAAPAEKSAAPPKPTAKPTVKPVAAKPEAHKKPASQAKKRIEHLATKSNLEWSQADLESKKEVALGAFGLYAIDDKFQGYKVPKSQGEYADAENKLIACVDEVSDGLTSTDTERPMMLIVNMCATSVGVITGFE